MKTEVLKIKLMSMIPEEVAEYVGNVTNLKLYDASYLACKVGEENDNLEEMCDLFNDFCDDSFKEFMEGDDAPMEGLKLCNIGSTSMFRIDTEDELYGRAYYYDNYNNASKEERKQMLYEEFLYLQNTDEVEFDEMEKDEIELLIDEMKDYMESFKDIINAYKAIDNFKKNQVEYFKDYLEGYDIIIPEEA